MAEDRRTKQDPTPGEDPREIDREQTADADVRETGPHDGLVHGQRPHGGLGTSADAPGRDLDELRDAPEVTKLREQS
ncbi:hypothetical protein CLV30_12630 [Haloactinopolyspora alba]|uniref:Uncharacterized protein n=1 Tax=Haloactinopolyspora alba TaxID=648780 RepID=A0A2P8DGP5_9ACTN|nr:hypothetical protein [Haloactinopolyspora alba]PSK96371.1 hypothetical protein CLV30_12630 [Haloactinopolyspora alba]